MPIPSPAAIQSAASATNTAIRAFAHDFIHDLFSKSLVIEENGIQDYDPWGDLLDLGGGEVASYVQSAGSVVLFAGAGQT